MEKRTVGKSLAYLKLLFGNDKIKVAQAWGKPDVQEYSRWVRRAIQSALGGRDTSKASSWVAAARELGASVLPLAEEDRDQVMYNWTTREIFYDPDQDEWTICRQICHELAHHVLCYHHGGQIRNGIERYDDNRESLQHRIAKEVELYFFGKRANLNSTPSK